MLAGFKWIAEQPVRRPHASGRFGCGVAYSVLQSWQRLAAEWNRAQGDSAAEQVFS